MAKLEDLLKIVDITDEEYNKLGFKEKQRYFKARNKLAKIFFVSKSKNGKGLTYRKPKKATDE